MQSDSKSEERRPLLEDLVECHGLLRRAAEREGDRLARPRGAGNWTASEHILHAALLMEWVANGFSEEPPLMTGEPLSAWRLSWVLMSYRIPSGLESPPELRPRVILGRSDLTARIDAIRERLLPIVRQGDLEKTINLPHFADVHLAQALRYSVVHARHHLRRLDS